MSKYTDAEAEKILDARIMRRLASDAAYRNAANSEQQSVREMQIEDEEVARLAREEEDYAVAVADAFTPPDPFSRR